MRYNSVAKSFVSLHLVWKKSNSAAEVNLFPKYTSFLLTSRILLLKDYLRIICWILGQHLILPRSIKTCTPKALKLHQRRAAYKRLKTHKENCTRWYYSCPMLPKEKTLFIHFQIMLALQITLYNYVLVKNIKHNV